MVITYFGRQYFKLTLGDLTIALNPPEKDSKPTRFGADIVLSSLRHPDYAGFDTVTLGGKTPFVIDGPGDYEVRGLFFKGATSNTTIKGKKYFNTVFGFELDGIKIAFMGVLSDEGGLSPEAKEIASRADIIFVPVGASGTLDAVQAYKLAVSFDPSIVIPMDFEQDGLKRFLKEGGQEGAKAEEKLTIKRKDLEGKEAHIVVLEPQG